jgi:Protein of unknown function (DUF2934)
MPRAKRAQVTTMEAPAEPATAASSRKKNGKNGKNGNANAAFDLEAAIRARAYELYEKRGRQDGQAQTDWFQAEAELRSRVSRTA